jgi:hypothetical protein
MATIIAKEPKIATRRTGLTNRTKSEPVILPTKIISDFIVGRNKKSLKDLKGKISFRDDYDYKSMRS